ncbi:TatD family hydrolase [Ottowia thiooxydans]|uniref:TatD family hydrolase n=1 Tax=Ottowia thiooxydans TaxID=219182 RepID=UPI000427605E|nr:TatD family hydrolase [Ottowia thiooxydans]
MQAWIDTHCHLDAPEFTNDVEAVRKRAAFNNVSKCIIPAVEVPEFEAARGLAHRFGDAYALGIHPLFVERAAEDALARLDESLGLYAHDPSLVAVGEIGLDYFVPALNEQPLRARQELFYREQLKLARRYERPVILHVRRSVDAVLKGLRDIPVPGGIAHAFNGSLQQAQIFVEMGFKLGFGGAVTYERATRLRELAKSLPIESLVLETDAPDIPPRWLYATSDERSAGKPQGRNEPGELPRIASVIAALRGISEQELMERTTQNALAAIPGLAKLLEPSRG